MYKDSTVEACLAAGWDAVCAYLAAAGTRMRTLARARWFASPDFLGTQATMRAAQAAELDAARIDVTAVLARCGTPDRWAWRPQAELVEKCLLMSVVLSMACALEPEVYDSVTSRVYAQPFEAEEGPL